MIENFQEITDYIEKNKDTEEVSNFINGLKTPITRDAVEQWTKEGEGRSWLDRNCDIYSSKAIETARTKAIEKYEAEVLPKKLEEYKKEAEFYSEKFFRIHGDKFLGTKKFLA